MDWKDYITLIVLVATFIGSVLHPFLKELGLSTKKMRDKEKSNRDEQEKEHQKIRDEQKIIELRREIKEYYDIFSYSGLSSHEYETLHTIYDEYKKLGGNSYVDRIVNEMDAVRPGRELYKAKEKYWQ